MAYKNFVIRKSRLAEDLSNWDPISNDPQDPGYFLHSKRQSLGPEFRSPLWENLRYAIGQLRKAGISSSTIKLRVDEALSKSNY